VDDKFLRLVIIHKRDIDIFVKCTSDAATYTSVWQEYMALLKRNILRGMEVSAFICLFCHFAIPISVDYQRITSNQ